MTGKIRNIKVLSRTSKFNLGTVLFFHGAGDSGEIILDRIKSLVGDLGLPHIKFVFPTAPGDVSLIRFWNPMHLCARDKETRRALASYALEGDCVVRAHVINEVSTHRVLASCALGDGVVRAHIIDDDSTHRVASWALGEDDEVYTSLTTCAETRPSLSNPQLATSLFVKFTQVPLARTIKNDLYGYQLYVFISGGFSMGGALALQTAYRFVPGLAGVFALSSFLSDDSLVYDALKKTPSSTPLLMCHGDKDLLVHYNWGKATFANLEKLKVRGEFVTIRGAEHELEKEELRKVLNWIVNIMPDK